MAKFSKKKIQALVTAGVTSVALLITGTFAWKSISQEAINKIKVQINPGARLHDDFNGTNKDIYVENFTDPNNGSNIYARIQLREYMETGEDAGNNTGSTTGRNITVIGKKDAKIADPTTWHTHKMDIDTTEAVDFHNYWTWEMGNEDATVEKYYMPTFNKDNESLDADINGTLAGIDKDKKTGTPYDDYQEWNDGDKKTQKETLNGGQQSTEDVEHIAKKVDHHAKVISMRQWKEAGKQPGAYWVYDTDGWAYWAQAIAPGETTGLLLNGVKSSTTPEENYYYMISAKGQFATAGDWTGFNNDITTDGKELLDIVANRLPEVVFMAPKNGYEQFVVAGQELKLEVNMNIKNGKGDPLESAVEWSIDDTALANTIDGDIFRPTDKMSGKSYKITGTSKLTPSVKTTITVAVLPTGLNNSNTIEGADKKRYVDFGYNVYKRVEDDGSLSSEFISAGKDTKIGTSDDKTNVYDIVTELGGAHLQYGRFFLPEGKNRYKAMGQDQKLGTTDDIIVTSLTNQWPMNIGTILANKVKITPVDGTVPTDNVVEVKVGQSKQFKAEVYLANELIDNQNVTWSIVGGGAVASYVRISENGLLKVQNTKYIKPNTYLTVRATSKEDPTHASNYITVKITALGYEDIPSITVGSSDTTVRIGDMDYYVMANDGEKALLWAKTVISDQKAHETSTKDSVPWRDWTLRTYLNDIWLNSQEEVILNNIIESAIYTSNEGTGIIETKDKVFLLNEHDIVTPQHISSPELLTAGKRLAISGDMYAPTLLRGATKTGPYTKATITNTVGTQEIRLDRVFDVRPAFWIKLSGSTTGGSGSSTTN